MVGDGGPAGHDLGVAAHKGLGMRPVVELHQVGVAVKVVEVLQQGEVQRLLHIGIVLALGQHGRQVHGQLLVAQGVLQDRLVRGLQRRHQLLLLLLQAAQQGNLAAQLVVGGVPGELVAVPDRLEFRAVHQDHPRAGVGIHRPAVVGQRRQLTPVHDQVLQLAGLQVKWIHFQAPFCVFGNSICEIVPRHAIFDYP